MFHSPETAREGCPARPVKCQKGRFRCHHATARGLGRIVALAPAPAHQTVDVEGVWMEEIKREEVGGWMVKLIRKREWDVKLREGGEMKSCRLVSGVELNEQTIETHEALVGVLRCEIHAVVVVPERAQGFIDVAIGPAVGVESGQNVGIVLVAELPYFIKVTRGAVAFRRTVSIMQLRSR